MTIQVDKKTLSIGILTLTAAALALANLAAPQGASGGYTVQGKDYQVVTARMGQGGDGLYVFDGGSDLMAIFTYDPTTRSLKPRNVRSVADAFAAGVPAPAVGRKK